MKIKTKFGTFEVKKEMEHRVTPEMIVLSLQRKYGTENCEFEIIDEE